MNISAPANNMATSPACTGTGASMSCTANGLGHAFTNAYNLVDSVRYDGSNPTGLARTVSASNANGLVPQALIHTIGNILQSCVDSAGVTNSSSISGTSSDGTHCGDLFEYATAGGVTPSNTLQVALNMAKYPTSQVSNLFTLQPRAVFFTPDLASVPTSFALAIFYGTNQSGSYTNTIVYPVDITLDAQDNAYAAYGSGAPSTYTAVAGFAASGAPLFVPTQNSGFKAPSQITVDSLGHLYVSNDDPNYGAILQASTTSGSLTEAVSFQSSAGLAVDLNNNLWVTTDSTSQSTLNEFKYGTLQSGGIYSAPDFSYYNSTVPVFGVAIDAAQNIWGVSTATNGNSYMGVLKNTGTVASPTYSRNNDPIAALSTFASYGISLNNNGVAYIPEYTVLDQVVLSNGTVTPNPNGTAGTSGSKAPHKSEVDGNGTIFWTDLEATGVVNFFVPPVSGSLSSGMFSTFLPCYPVVPSGSSGLECLNAPDAASTKINVNPRGMAIDSAGNVWFVADTSFGGGSGQVVEVLGTAAPTWPLMSYNRPGTKPQ